MLMPYRRYADFNGRSRRKEYWLFTLFFTAVYFGLVLLSGGLGTSDRPALLGAGMILALAMLVFVFGSFIPALAVAVRRLHDTGRSGWWVLIGLVPLVGFVVLLIFYVQDGTPGPNKFGPSPKAEGTAQVFA